MKINLLIKIIIFFFKRFINIKIFRKKVLISRAACLVNDSYNILNKENYRINFQKSRVDILNDNFYKKLKPKILDIKYIQEHLYGVYLEQYFNFWNYVSKSDVFIMDSYSELTDQLFVNLKSDNAFCSNYSDVDKKIFKFYKCYGLLKMNDIQNQYDLFFRNLRLKNKQLKIIYVFFPIINEKRNKLMNQNMIINKAIDNLKEEHNLNVLRIPEKILKKNKEGEFPYHYNQEVYSFLSSELNNIL